MRNYEVGIKCWLPQTRAVELQQKKYTQERDAEARIKEQNAFILQRQTARGDTRIRDRSKLLLP